MSLDVITTRNDIAFLTSGISLQHSKLKTLNFMVVNIRLLKEAHLV